MLNFYHSWNMVEAGFMHQRGNLWLSAVHNQTHKISNYRSIAYGVYRQSVITLPQDTGKGDQY